MVLAALTQHALYESLHPLFGEAFRFLKNNDLLTLPDGKHLIAGDDLFAIVSRNGSGVNPSRLEAHNRYIDIHVALSGSDTIGWKPRQDCREPVDAFNEKDDYILYHDRSVTQIPLSENQFMILFPEDAHAPLLHTTDLFKIVLKIKL